MSVIHLDFRTFGQATEVEERVRKAMTFSSGIEDIKVEHSEGYHGNKILIMTCTVSRKADIRSFFRRLSRDDLSLLLDSIDQRMDEDGQFFFRLDKQKAFQEELVISSGDDCIHVRAKVESYPKRREKALENAKVMLQELLDRQAK
ncbi:MAG TPA: RNA-binding domain-containing protein [Methanomassiliicoccales archaeon]|nr:RNA-binding domain-containing protein [Methanomassiliicoccales archaeon]